MSWGSLQAAEPHGRWLKRLRAELTLSHISQCGDVIFVWDCMSKPALGVGRFVAEVASAAAMRTL